MATAAIKINGGAAGSNTDLPINTLVALTNNDNSGAVSWTWAIVDQPPGAADALSSSTASNPTFTPTKEGTYLVRLVVNQGLATEVSDQVVAAVRQLRTRTRVPAYTETTEADAAGDGWATSVDETLRLVDAMRADPMVIVGVAGAAGLTRGMVMVAVTNATIMAGLPGEALVPSFTAASPTTVANATIPMFVLEGGVDGSSSPASGDLVMARRFGMAQDVPVTGAAAPGDPVYAGAAGTLSTTPASASYERFLGYVMAANGANWDIMFDGTLFQQSLVTNRATFKTTLDVGTTSTFAGQMDCNGGMQVETGQFVFGKGELSLRAATGNEIDFYVGVQKVASLAYSALGGGTRALSLGSAYTHALAGGEAIRIPTNTAITGDGTSQAIALVSISGDNVAYGDGTTVSGETTINCGSSGSIRAFVGATERFSQTANQFVTDGGRVHMLREVQDANVSIDLDDEHVVFFDLTVARAATLPLLSSVLVGQEFTISADASGAVGSVLVSPQGGETIAGAANYTINTAWGSVTVRASATLGWLIIAKVT
jgi:PKD repeat protein